MNTTGPAPCYSGPTEAATSNQESLKSQPGKTPRVSQLGPVMEDGAQGSRNQDKGPHHRDANTTSSASEKPAPDMAPSEPRRCRRNGECWRLGEGSDGCVWEDKALGGLLLVPPCA